MHPEVRLAQTGDKSALLDFLCEVHGVEFRDLAENYVSSMFSKDFRKPKFIIAFESNHIVGTAAYSEELFTTDTWGISWVGVAKSHRNKGIGTILIKECFKNIKAEAKKPVTVILASYPHKTGLYDKLGFKSVGKSHDDGQYMIKVINDN